MAETNDPSGSTSSTPTSSPARLLDLPLDIFLIIWDDLPPYARASLTLTCRSLYISHHATILQSLNQEIPSSRLQKLYLLRRLRKDSPPPLPFLCHSCLKLHPPSLPPSRPKTIPLTFPLPPVDSTTTSWSTPHALPPGSGFPYCTSAYSYALADFQARCTDPRDRGPACYRGTSDSHFRLRYNIIVDVGRLGLYMWTKLELSELDYNVYRPDVAGQRERRSPAEMVDLIRNTHLEFCSHLFLGGDFVRGDGSMSDVLADVCTEAAMQVGVAPEERWRTWMTAEAPRTKYLRDFVCERCHVNVKIQTPWMSGVTVFVWRYQEPRVLGEGERAARVPGAERWASTRYVEDVVERGWWGRLRRI